MHGRAGREGLDGNVIIQTYNPESFPIECAKEQDYLKFYDQEINLRRVLKYPPFCDIIKLEVTDLEEEIANNTINLIYEKLLKLNDNKMNIYAPMPSPISKIKNRYRFRIIIKCLAVNNIIKQINEVVDSTKINGATRISIDINPNNMS